MRHNWKLWVLGIVLMQLLVVGLDVVLLWPVPSEAESKAAAIQEGMTFAQVKEMLGPYHMMESYGFVQQRADGSPIPLDGYYSWGYSDGSGLTLKFQHDEADRPTVVIGIERKPPTSSVDSQTRLRRTLSHIFPALGE